MCNFGKSSMKELGGRGSTETIKKLWANPFGDTEFN